MCDILNNIKQIKLIIPGSKFQTTFNAKNYQNQCNKIIHRDRVWQKDAQYVRALEKVIAILLSTQLVETLIKASKNQA